MVAVIRYEVEYHMQISPATWSNPVPFSFLHPYLLFNLSLSKQMRSPSEVDLRHATSPLISPWNRLQIPDTSLRCPILPTLGRSLPVSSTNWHNIPASPALFTSLPPALSSLPYASGFLPQTVIKASFNPLSSPDHPTIILPRKSQHPPNLNCTPPSAFPPNLLPHRPPRMNYKNTRPPPDPGWVYYLQWKLYPSRDMDSYPMEVEAGDGEKSCELAV
jgi:hypothetical protein